MLAALTTYHHPPMPDINERLPENSEGRFYVDNTCIDCDQCRDTAPAFFRRHDDLQSSYVHRQPETQEEIELCMDAMDGCPTESIGDEGERG